jgi:hypothetical protein
MSRNAAKLSVVDTCPKDEIIIEDNEYTLGLCDFIYQVMEPSASFSRLLLSSSDNGGPPCCYEDIGQVTSALAALAKNQMNCLMTQFEKEVGKLTIVLPVNEDVPVTIGKIFLQNKGGR